MFGIDDALIASLIGPLVQVLPQLMNSANQQRVQLRQSDNQLVGGILSEIQRRLLLDQVLAAQRQGSPAGSPGPDLDALRALLEQAPPAPAAGSAAPPARTQSLSATVETGPPAPEPSRSAVLTPASGLALTLAGRALPLYVRDRAISLRWRFDVAPPVPASAVPRAILELTVSAAGPGPALHRTSRRLTDVAAGSELAVDLSPAVLAELPVGEPLSLVATLRWPGARGRRVYQATGATEIALVGPTWVQEQGGVGSEEREPADMTRYRPFWNKIWEAPSLGRDATGQQKAYRWQLDVVARYAVLLDVAHPANGLMETRVQRAPEDPDSVVDRTEGRLKAGIELSVEELSKLTALWEGVPALTPAQQDALHTAAFARAHVGELIHPLRLAGRPGQRGMVWVVPLVRLRELTLASPASVDDTGRVVTVTTEVVRVPVPVAARVLGLLGADGDTTSAGSPDAEAGTGGLGAGGDYQVEGFTVAMADRVPLTAGEQG